MVAAGNPILNTETSQIRDENDDDVQLNNNDAGYSLGFDLELETIAENEKEAPKKKHRGPTKLTQVHARTREERQYIILNSFGQPVGPTKEIVEEFKFFLGTLGKDSELAPLNNVNFRDLPTHDKIWDYVLEKYIVPEAGRKYAMEAVNTSWRSYKCRFKKNHFYAYATDELRWKNKPDTISEESKTNRENHLLLNDMHTMGRKGFAILRHELDPDKQEPSQAKVYKESRKRVPGRTYLTNPEKTKENIAKLDALESTQDGEEGRNSKDLISEVIQGPKSKSKSRVPLYGKGVTKSDLKKKEKKSGFLIPEEFLQSMKTELVQQLAPHVVSMIVSQIQEANPEINIVIPDFVTPSIQKDASSAPHVSERNGQSDGTSRTINQLDSLLVYLMATLLGQLCES
ncbi:uncharacterized protein [Spinacia oleracea]|uniref:Transposase MuDR plant domain-containing protein n=1 Tax=Spinacia oleracea TaxID=3562 RepID=A0A9R0JYD4_SPIOL|nr:uncharacterized protein LOC110790541 [Spinacia oleracea]